MLTRAPGRYTAVLLYQARGFTMFDWLAKHALEWLKTPAHYFLPLLAASFFGLFAPLDFLEFLGIAFWRAEGKPYLGSVFVVSVAVTGAHYAASIVHWLVGKYRVFLSVRAAQARLNCLSSDEKNFLARYLQNDSHVQSCWIHNSIAAVLRTEGIIYVAVEQGMTDSFPFTIYPWAWKYLKKNHHLLVVEGVKRDAKP